MEPERLAWKVFQLHHLSNAPHTRVFFFFFFGLQDSCLFLSSKKAFRTPDEPEIPLGVGWVWQCAAYRDAHLASPCLWNAQTLAIILEGIFEQCLC